MINKTTKTMIATAMIAVFAIATTIGTTSVFADHVTGGGYFEDHIWTRTSSDGHSSYISCTSSNCDLKLKTTSGVQGYTQTELNTEVDDVETHFDNIDKNMSIDRVSTADSIIHQTNLASNTHGKSVWTTHCTDPFLWWCNGYDNHFLKMDVQINNNANEIKFQLAEDENASPPEYDLRKTVGHELFHSIGMDHHGATGQLDSIVYYVYVFGSSNGYEMSTYDEDNLEDQYP